jgi:CubicO group peptidase (beta-lactamase class C family)
MRLAILALAATLAAPLAVQAATDTLPPALAGKIDAVVAQVLKQGDTPSISLAVVKDGRLAYVKAYGEAVIKPAVKATPSTRYQIASVSKAFVSAAALILQQEGKLSLDDHVSKWFPDLTDADKITVRQLLSHTSGYSDYWAQDYLMPPMAKPTTPAAIMAEYAKAPLDYKPGDDWQYSNTGYVVAGQIIEKAAGQPLYEVLKTRIFIPLHITDAVDADATRLKAPDAAGYERKALGPLRPSPYEGEGWLYAAGQLGMTAEAVAKWDISLIDRTLLRPESYAQEFTPIKLNNGKDSGYSLGLFVGKEGDRPIIHHGGEGSGYLAENRIYPNEKLAIVVLSNSLAGSPQSDIADSIAYLILPPTGVDARMQTLFEGLQHGKVDRAAFTDNFNAYLSPGTVADYAASLGPLGAPTQFKLTRTQDRGGMKFRAYRVVAGGKTLRLTVYLTKADKVEQFLVYAAN